MTHCPVLTNDEIVQIDELAKKCGNYKYGKTRPKLADMKYYYDRALEKYPALNIDNPTQDQYYKENILAVDKLKKIKVK